MKVLQRVNYVGPNRHSEYSSIALTIEPDLNDVKILPSQSEEISAKLNHQLTSAGLSEQHLISSRFSEDVSPEQVFSQLYVELGINLQRFAGHRVSWSEAILPDPLGHNIALFEFERVEVGKFASDLALNLIYNAAPGLLGKDFQPLVPVSGSLKDFEKLATALMLPLDTEMIVNAARRAKVPCFKLGRYPYPEEPRNQGVRNNRQLKLGQGCYQLQVDGFFCTTRSGSLISLLDDLLARRKLLKKLNIPVPNSTLTNSELPTANEFANLGYPLRVKNIQGRGSRLHARPLLNNRKQLSQSLITMQQRPVLVERAAPGMTHALIVANQQIIGLVKRPFAKTKKNFDKDLSTAIHSTWIELTNTLSEYLDVGALVVYLVTDDINTPVSINKDVVMDFDLAPDLHRLLTDGSVLGERVADHFIDWLFPNEQKMQIPRISITGTNGKTTSCRMIANILRQAGKKTGLACTDGVYIQDKKLYDADLSGYLGHHAVLDHPATEVAVLETAHGGIMTLGLACDDFDIAACTNVAADHIGENLIETVEQIAEIKIWPLLRATNAVVLNADNPYCLKMLSRLVDKKICLTSRNLKLDKIAKMGCQISCTIETHDGEAIIVIQDEQRHIPIVAINQIPATWGGAAKHNIDNALIAVSCCYLQGVPINDIKMALEEFESSFDNTPGRLNVCDELPFRVVLDYVHNMAGLEETYGFIDACAHADKKIVLFTLSADRPDQDARNAAQFLASRFDYFICRGRTLGNDENRMLAADRMQRELIAAGVSNEHIAVFEHMQGAVDHALEVAQAGDLVLLSAGKNYAEAWQIIGQHVRKFHAQM